MANKIVQWQEKVGEDSFDDLIPELSKNIMGTGKLGTTTGVTSTTDRQPDHIFEENSNTVKNSSLINNVNFRIENNVLKADDRILNNIVNLFTGNTEISTNTTYDLLSTISNGDIIEISALVENRACYLKFKVDLTKEQYLSSTDIFSGTTFSLVRFYGLYINLTSSTITIGLSKNCALKIPTTQNDNVVSQWAERNSTAKLLFVNKIV